MAERPKTMKETVDRIWEVVEGSNGSGLKALAAKNRDDISEIKQDIAFIKGNVEGHMNTGSDEPKDHRPSAKQITLRRVAEIAVGTLVSACVLGLFIMLFVGRLTSDDIAKILSAWKGGGM